MVHYSKLSTQATTVFNSYPGRVQTVDSTRHPEHPARHPVVWRMGFDGGVGGITVDVGDDLMGSWRDERGDEVCA